jgi:hypothetical protein
MTFTSTEFHPITFSNYSFLITPEFIDFMLTCIKCTVYTIYVVISFLLILRPSPYYNTVNIVLFNIPISIVFSISFVSSVRSIPNEPPEHNIRYVSVFGSLRIDFFLSCCFSLDFLFKFLLK